MSVLSEAYAVPSRVIGAYRYLLQARNRSESREALEAALAPESLRRAAAEEDREGGGLKMAQATVRECLAMRLFEEDGGDVRLHPDLPETAREAGGEQALPLLLSDLFFGPRRENNHDLGLVIAWYLTLDADDAPGTWDAVDKALRERVGGARFGVTNTTPYGMFEDWACYLGFAWKHALKVRDASRDAMTPDPTAQLRWRLPVLFQGRRNERHGLPELTARLGSACPVLEGGFLRQRVEEQVGAGEPGSLSSATARAWLRLEEEGAVELVRESDAPALTLADGEDRRAVSHAVWLQGN